MNKVADKSMRSKVKDAVIIVKKEFLTVKFKDRDRKFRSVIGREIRRVIRRVIRSLFIILALRLVVSSSRSISK
jgi:hypothetical protein